jgi:diguanylate cyclase (GGDEF)-like protein
MHKNKRSSDIAGRLGGEEFAPVLPEATPDRAMAAAERYRTLIDGRPVIAKGHQISVTVSVGVSIADAGMAGFDEVLKRADIALYEAKNSGRNRVCRFAAQPA